MKPPKTQSKVLNQMDPNKWYSAYDLQCSIATLQALWQKGFVRQKTILGAIFSPRVNVTFQRIESNQI